eukprot:2849535-Alexandrium_andersonii.AAC.1
MRKHLAQRKALVSRAADRYEQAVRSHHTITATLKPGRGDLVPEPDQTIMHMCYDCGRAFKHNKGL